MKPRDRINEMALLAPVECVVSSSQMWAQIEAIKNYLDETIPALEKKIDEIRNGGENNNYYYSERFNVLFSRLNKIEKGELKCCPNCHTIEEQKPERKDELKCHQCGSDISGSTCYQFPNSHRLFCSDECLDKFNKWTEKPSKEEQKPDFGCALPGTSTVDSGDIYMIQDGKICYAKLHEDPKPESDHKWMLSVDGNSIELPDAKDLPAGSSFTITNTGTNPITVSEKQSMQVKIGAEIIKNKKPECKEYEHEWDVSYELDGTVVYRRCYNCNKRQFSKIEKWEDVK